MKMGWPHCMDTSRRFTQSPSLSSHNLNAFDFILQPTRSQNIFKSLYSSVPLAHPLILSSATFFLQQCLVASCPRNFWRLYVTLWVQMSNGYPAYSFHKLDQTAGNSIGDYDTNLRKLTSQCKFTCRRHFVIFLCVALGTRPFNAVRLLSEVDLTYAKVMVIASRMEPADRNVRSFKG